MRTLGVYLLYAATALRGIVRFWDNPGRVGLLTALVAYGLLLAIPLRLLPGSPAGSQPGAGRPSRRTLLASAYLVIQVLCVMSLFTLRTGADFFALLFVPLSLQAVLFFPGRAGYLWIAFFCLCILVGLQGVEPEALFGFGMTVFYGALCFLFGGYADQVHRAEAARQENQRLLADLETAHVQLQRYAHQVEDLAAEHARTRLARELHDSVTQTAFSMNLAVQSAQLLLGRDAALLAAQLERVEQLAASAINEMQALLSELSGGPAVPQPLGAALGKLAAERQQQDGLRVVLQISGDLVLPEKIARNLYSIAQEALTNVTRHAGVSEARLCLSLEPGNLALEIEDCGQGFDVAAQAGLRGHLGLAGMQERAREIGWRFSVESQPGSGTRLRVSKAAREDVT